MTAFLFHASHHGTQDDPLFRFLTTQLRPDESILATLTVDLDARRRYARSLLALVGAPAGQPDAPCSGAPARARLLAIDSCDGEPLCQRAWSLEEIDDLASDDRGGAGVLQALAPSGLLAEWHYTAARKEECRRFVARFDALRRSVRTGEPLAGAADRTCPACGKELPEDSPVCSCTRVAEKPAVTSLLRLLLFARSRVGMTLAGLLLTLASTAAGLVPPYLTMPILDRVLVPYQSGEPARFDLLPWLLGGVAGAALLAWLLGWAKTYVLAWVSERISADLRNATYEHLHKLSVNYFGGKRTGDLIARVSSDTDRICFFLSVHLLDFASDVLMIAMTSAVLVSIDWPLALATLFPLPVIGYLVHRVRNRLRRGFALGRQAWAEMTSVLADTIPGIRVVKAFAQERREVQRFRRANDRILQANDRVNTVWSFYGPLITLLTDLGLLIIWMVGIWRVLHGQVTVGVLTAFVAYIGRFYTRLDSMSRMVAAVQRAAASAQRLFAILDEAPSVAEPAQPVRLNRVAGEIELRDVGFRYGDREILRGLNLDIRPGEMIGLVGPSGSGKTTLANLVCRFYDVSEGAILVDGVDIRSYSLAEYRRNIGIVLQEPFLFYGTIAENIAYGRPDASREEIVAAARAARAHEFILRLPDGYDSLVGERGQSLSGGERQRISIARALLIDPRILILDEATSAVDTETEREIQLALENLVRGRTTIAIAHRLSTLRQASRLVVLDRGQIQEVGDHDELLAFSGLYSRLYHAQLQHDAEDPRPAADEESSSVSAEILQCARSASV